MIIRRQLQIGKDGSGNPVVWELHGSTPDWSSPFCFLLHGYNLDPKGAAAAYDQLFQIMQSGAGNLRLPALLQSRSWLVYWPGYESGGLARGKTLTSPLTYASQIPSALEAAQALRKYLDARDRRTQYRPQISIIAHSLGCRVALELLESYATLPDVDMPEFPLLVLMAAAVPVYFIEQLLRLWRGALLPQQRLVLYSKGDFILSGPIFGAGQTYAREGLFPKAIGKTGRPHGGYWTNVVQTRNGHSDYFEDRLTGSEIARACGLAPERALQVAGGLDLAAQMRRSLPELKLCSRRTEM